jgi:hypothetical protein
MRPIVISALAIVLFLQPAARTQTQDEAKAIIGKAIKAMGIDKDPEGIIGFRTKTKGTLDIMGMSINLTQNVTIRFPNQFKEALEMDINNMKIPVTTVYDGKKGWVEANGKLVKLDDKITAELKEVGNLIKVGRLKPLLDKKNNYELTVIGDVKVEDKEAVGVRVSSKGAKDLSLYFDKKTGMLAKLERQALDAMTGQEVQEERIIRSYSDKDGQKVPHEIVVMRDGKKFLEAEVLEFTPLQNVDPSEFDMPK